MWLSQGAGRIEGIRDGRLVESWFVSAPGDDRYAFVYVQDRAARSRAEMVAFTVSGTAAFIGRQIDC
jgi:hypothetical protein